MDKKIRTTSQSEKAKNLVHYEASTLRAFADDVICALGAYPE